MSSRRDADALVIFGITGDLARKMTLRSLYRLEQRKLLEVPVIGVAVEPWSVDQLREHARKSIAEAARTSTRRCSSVWRIVSAMSAATSATTRRTHG